MPQINLGSKEVSCKIVYYGPGKSGKTTNLEQVHKRAPKDAVGALTSIATEQDRTLYFDFLPLDLGKIAGMTTRFQLYTVPGQIYYDATRKLVLRGVDGIIFVADSSVVMREENRESLENLRVNLAEIGLQFHDPSDQRYVPVVLQYNKRDARDAMSIEDMQSDLNPQGSLLYFEATARDGNGVFATLKGASSLVIDRLNRLYGSGASKQRRTVEPTKPLASSGPSHVATIPSKALPPAFPALPSGSSPTPPTGEHIPTPVGVIAPAPLTGLPVKMPPDGVSPLAGSRPRQNGSSARLKASLPPSMVPVVLMIGGITVGVITVAIIAFMLW
jgi:signal recognition particle receptor subunit beta